MNIIFWIISAFLQAIWWSFRKKAIDNSTLPPSLFAIPWPIIWATIVYSLLYFFDTNLLIYIDYKIILLILIISSLEILSNYLEIYSFKNTKISNLLPYGNTNSLFIILIWFFLYYWTKNSTSITTFIITLITIFIIIWFSIDFKKIKIDKVIGILWKTLSAITALIIWYILINYSSIEYMSINVIFWFTFYFLITIITKEKFKQLLKQESNFYTYRTIALVLWWVWFLIGLYIIESAWLLIATLIWFIWLIFRIFSMKFILKDNPSKKQIILAFIVSILIWIWYYLK